MSRLSPELRRFLAIWIAESVVITPLVVLFVGPIFWPGKQSNAAAGQVTDFTVSLGVGTPLLLLVVTFVVYALANFRQKGDGLEDGPQIHGHRGLTILWITKSSLVVLGLFIYATVRIVEPGAAGSGQGPSPLSTLPAASKEPVLPVQVIGQQWQFTYRYPTYDVETPHLVLPRGRTVRFHVTSLDVIHSFWAYELGVKADANPGVDNVAYATPRQTGSFDIRCAELCGIWHGYMFDTGRVVTPDAFSAWIKRQKRTFAPTERYLPPYKPSYEPDPQRRAG